MMSRQRRRLLMVSVSLLIVMFTSVQFQAQNLLPPPPAPGENVVVEPVAPDANPVRLPAVRDAELLQNGGFETAGTTNKQAANWKGINLLSSSGRVCNRIGHPTKPDRIVAYEGNCAYRFSAQITNVKRQIKQVAATMSAANDTLQMSYWAAGTDISDSPRAQVVVTYTDNTKKKFSVSAPTGTYGYTQFSGGISLEKTPKKIVVKFIVVGSGKLYIDGASLRHEFYQYAPTAVDDSLTAVIGTAAVAGNVIANDNLANPAAAVSSFGGGSFGGAVTDNAPGAAVAIPGSGGVTVSVAVDGTVSVDAPAGTAIPGAYTFDYQLSNTAGSDTATVTLNVRSAPVARADLFTTLANTTLVGDLVNVDNGSGPDLLGVPAATITSFGGISLGGDVTSNPAGSAVSLAGGTVTVNPNGAFTLSNPLQGGQFAFNYRLSNAAGFSDATVTIHIQKAPNAVNDGPYNVNVNTTLNVTTAGNDLLDNDDRGFPLATLIGFGLITAADRAPGMSESVAGGTLVVNADGSFSVINPTITGTYTFHYAIGNGVGQDTATVTFNVRRPPLAENDAFNMLVNGTLNGDLKANNGSGIDIPGSPPFNTLHFGGGDVGGGVTANLAPASVTLAGGTLTINADGTFSLVNPLQTGIFTFSYRLTNAIPAFDNATVTIEIRRAPVAVNDGPYVVGTGQTLTVTAAASNDLLDNDARGFPQATISNFGGGNVSAFVTDLPAGGTANNFGGGNLTVNADGSFTLATPTIPGTYTFQYRLSNTAGFSDATVTIQVQQSPVAQNDAFNMLLNSTLNGSLTANNGFGADNPGTPAFNSLQFGGGDLGGDVTSNPAPAARTLAGGALTVNADGTFSLLNPTQTGVFSFTYRLTNTIPASDDATVTIEVRKAPTAVADGVYTVGTGQTLTVTTAATNDLLDNDDRGYPLALVARFGGGSLGGTVSDNLAGASVALAGGTLTVNANGSFSLAATTTPGTYTFVYRLSNVAGFSDATVTILVQQSPIAEDDAFIVQINGTLNDDLNDDNGSGADSPGVPPYNSLTFGGGSVSNAVTDHVAPASAALAGGTLTVNLDGTFSLVNPTLTGVYTFDYRLNNAIPASDDATVTIDVRATPLAQDDTLIAEYGALTSFPAAALFADNGSGADYLGVPAAQIVMFGTLSSTEFPSGSTVSFAGGTLTVTGDGSFSIDSPTQTGGFSFYYRLQNISGFDDAKVNVTIQRAPVAENDSFIVQINATLSDDLNDNNGSGADVLGFPVATVASFGGGSLTGDASANAAGASVALAGGNLTVNADGTFSLVNPATTGIYTFQYRLSNTIPASDDATVTIDVRATPLAEDDAGLIAQYGVTTNFPAGTLFADNGSGADFLGVPAAPVVSFGNGDVIGSLLVIDHAAGATTEPGSFAGGTLTVNADGSLSVNNPTQTGSFSFMYRLENASGFDDAWVTLTIQRAPAANNDAFTFLHTANQTAPGGLFADNGSGADQLGFPAAALTHFGGGSLGGAVTDNVAGASVTLANGTLTVNANGSWSLTGQPLAPGTYTFEYRIENVVNASTATVTFNIQQPPVAVDDLTYTVISGQTLDLLDGNGLLVNDTRGFPQASITSYGGGDAGGNVTAYAANTSVNPLPGYANGMLQINAAGTGVFTPPTLPTRFCGEFDFSYRLGNGVASDDSDVKITVLCAPDAQNDLFNSGFTVDAGGVDLTGDLFADNGSGADFLGYEAATLTGFSAIGGGATSNAAGASIPLADGTLTVNGDGSFTVDSVSTPGTYTFDYTITNTAGSDIVTVTIVIDEAPRVTSITPANGAINVAITTNVVINFSEPVNIATDGITLECPDNSNITFAPALPLTNVTTVTVDPTSDLPGNTLCVVTVVSSLVTDTDTIDAPDDLDGDSDGIEGPDFTSSFTTAPVAVDDAYTVTPHLTYDSSAVTPSAFSVRNNDDPADITVITGFGATLATADGTVPNGTNAIIADGAGGQVVLNADGTFIFYPEAGDTAASGTATFFYTITGGDTAQVTLTFDAQEVVWFIDDNAAGTVCSATNVGTQACPAPALNTALGTAHTGNDTIFIAEGAYTCQITLKNNVKVIGDGATDTTLAAFSGVTPVSGSSFAPYEAFTGVDPVLTSTASCFTLGTGNTIRGLTVGNTTGYALTSANAVGTLTVTDVSINGSGGMFSLTNGGTFNGTFNELSSSAHANTVINLTNIEGTIVHTTGSISHANADNPTVRISGGSPTLTYSGGITKTAGGRVINIQGTTANTISFTGTVAQNVADGTGILIDDQTGGTVSFTTINLGSSGTRLTSAAITATDGSGTSTVTLGTVSLFTSSANALTVTEHDGTLNITGGSVNTLNGSAINVDGPVTKTTLAVTLANVTSSSGAGYGVQLADVGGTFAVTTLASLSSKTDGVIVSNSSAAVTIKELDISSTTADAVRLSNNTGSFTITGDGNFETIHTNGVGGTFSSIGDNAFDLNNVSNLQVTDVTVSGTGGHAVTGTGVSGTTIFSNIDMTNIGNANDEHVFNFQQNALTGAQVSGTLNINNSVITNFTDTGLYLENFTGALNLRITGNTWQNNTSTTACGGTNCDGHGILLRADGTASIVGLIQNNNINQIDGIGITANPEGNSGATMDLTIRQNTLTASVYAGPSNTNNGEIAISLRNQQGNGTLRFDVRENTVVNYSGEFAQGIIEVEGGDFTTTHGTIHANTIQHAHFGSPFGINADGGHTGGSGTTNFDLVVVVTNNTVSGPMYGSALYVLGWGGISGSDANAQITVTGNNFNVSPTAPFTRTFMIDFGDYNKGCFNITGNSIAAGVGGGSAIDMYYTGNASLTLQGMSGSGNANAIVYLNSANTLGTPAYVGDNNTINAAICATPVAPAPVP